MVEIQLKFLLDTQKKKETNDKTTTENHLENNMLKSTIKNCHMWREQHNVSTNDYRQD